MPDRIEEILHKDELHRQDLEELLNANGDERSRILARAAEVRNDCVGQGVHLRGLIEYSNRCRKNCLYCGIRSKNQYVIRYDMSTEDVLCSARKAWELGFGSVVLQSGERQDRNFILRIDSLIRKMMQLSLGELEITLSCGEQDPDTYRRWHESGALRYLLRFESSDQKLFYNIHPRDSYHDYSKRIAAIRDLKRTGYLTGSGMMIGLPGQTTAHLAEDIILLKHLDVDMVGMGPYIEHAGTPLYEQRDRLISRADRAELSLLAIAVLRLHMKHINIAASTALDALDPKGREHALAVGANVLMPNLTPACYRENYFLYENKPSLTEAEELVSKIEMKWPLVKK